MSTIIQMEGIHNIRDLGFTPVEGGIIRPGRLIRSSSLAQATKEDVRVLAEEYHLAQIIDLRSHTEAREAPDVYVPGAAYQQIPLIDEEAMGITRDEGSMRDMLSELAEMPDLKDMYALLATPGGSEVWRQVFALLFQPREGAVLWHCSEGKDRCGLVSAMVLYALGAKPGEVEADYLKTNIAAQPRAEGMYRQVLEKTGDEAIAQKIKAAFLAKSEYLQAAMAGVQKSYGGVDGFLERACGLDDRMRQALRERFVERG